MTNKFGRQVRILRELSGRTPDGIRCLFNRPDLDIEGIEAGREPKDFEIGVLAQVLDVPYDVLLKLARSPSILKTEAAKANAFAIQLQRIADLEQAILDDDQEEEL